MTTIHSFFLIAGNIFLLAFWLNLWFKILLLMIVVAAAIIFYFVKITTLKNERAEVERQLMERNELLLYAGKNEQKANDRFALAERNKGLLLSQLNHEIRTPMNGVLGMASLLNETQLSREQQDYTNTIISSGNTLLAVINEIIMNDVLEYAKVESGKELEAKDIDLGNCIEEVLDVFAAKAAKAGIDLLYYIEENVPEQIVGDVRRLRQILTNLVENSIKVTTKGEIFIGVKLMECKVDNGIKLKFEVRDTGAGMTADKRNALSKHLSMEQLSADTSVAGGVGLIICKKLVGLMGGSINLESTETEGTVFRFTINSKAGMQSFRRHVHSEITDLKSKKILVIDDNKTACDLMKKQLENLSMITAGATSGKEALELLTQVSFDLVITDLHMPEMDGIQLAAATRERYPALPVILLNPVNDDQYKLQPEIFGAVLNKPVKMRLLVDAIITLLRNKDKTGGTKQKAIHKLSDNFSKQYPLSILIAEDNPVNQQWTTKILSKLGYQTEVVSNGKEVLEVVSSKQYDLILMDVQMPEMDGLEATRMIRLCLESQPVVIAMTANVMQGDRQDCMQSGMDDYISKPVELNDLVGMLEKWAMHIKEKKQLSLQAKG